MKNQIILIAIIALLVGGIGGYVISKSEGYERGWMMGGWSDNKRERGDQKFNTDDTTDARNMHGMHGATPVTEQVFLKDMIPHHQEAVDTAKQVVARGSNEEVKTLAKAIISAQEKEIADMKSWYQAWYGEAYQGDDSYQPMMRDLTSLSGTELDRAFLEDMIMHHMGALMLAQQVAPSIEHAEMRQLAEAIAKTQSQEIITMRILLKQL